MGNIKIDIIIISFNSCELTLQCIKSIYDNCENIEADIIVVDNASTDNSVENIKIKYPKVKIIVNKKNLGYAAAVNIGMQYSVSDFVIISNSDVIYQSDSIKILIEYLIDQPDVGIVGPQQQFPNGKWEYSYGDIPGIKSVVKELLFISAFERNIRKLLWNKIKIDRYPKEVDYVDGAVLAFRKDIFIRLGGFDEDFFFYSEEADFCFRIKKSGMVVMFNPKARVTHYRGGSSSKNQISNDVSKMFIQTKILFCKKHYTHFITKLFIKLNILNTFIKSKLWHFIGILNIEKYKHYSNNEYYLYGAYNKIWKEENRKLENER